MTFGRLVRSDNQRQGASKGVVGKPQRALHQLLHSFLHSFLQLEGMRLDQALGEPFALGVS